MSYQALYRKYRPSSFEEVVGQKQIVQTLKNAIDRDRIGHAYLFCGPRGTGKTSIAKIFARTLNCTGEHKPCMECENCRLSLSGNHPDIIEIDAASNNGVDEVRSLIERVGYAPMEGKYKVYIIDEVHMMTTGAFNALLKTIEEPPAHVIFILATTEPNKVLPTILSRCQRFDFSRVSEPEIAARLMKVCEEENIELSDDAAREIALLADGGMRDALSILDQCIAYSPDKVDVKTVREIYGIARPEDFGQIFKNLNPQDISQSLAKLEELSNNGTDLKRFIADFINLLKNSLLYDLSRDSAQIPEIQKQTIRQDFAPSLPAKRMSLLNDLMEVYNKLPYASNILDYLETVLLKNGYETVPEIRNTQSEIGPAVQIQREKPYEKPEIQSTPVKKVPKQKDNHELTKRFWNSDVSRETFLPRSDRSKTPELTTEILLSMLVGADKAERKLDEEKLKDVRSYMNDIKYGRLAVSLDKGEIIASAPEYILYCSPGKMTAMEINEIESTIGYSNFTEKLTGKPKKVFSVPFSEKEALIREFRKRAAAGTLPAPYKVEHKPQEQVHQQSEEEFLRGIFPDLVVTD